MIKKINKFFKHLLLAFLLLGMATSQLHAEGTSTVSQNSSVITALSLLPSQNRGTFLGCPADNRLYFRISDFNTENLYYGFSWRNYSSTVALNPAITNVYMRVFNPLGTQVAQINLPSSGNGFISTWNEASLGANIAGSAPGGYTPLTFTPTMNGEYWVEIYRSDDGGNTQANTGTWSFTPFWDMQIATSAGTRFNGRIHCDKFAFNAVNPTQYYTSYDQDAAPEIYAWSADSNIIKINFTSEFKPIAFDVAVTEYGVTNTNNFAVDRRSQNNAVSPSFSNGYTLFVNTPDPAIYPAGVAPQNPQLQQPIIVGCSAPFQIRYTVFGAGDVRLLLDLNGVDGYQPNTTDVALEQFGAVPGLNTILWNGLDGLGAPVPSGTQFKMVLTYYKGRFNVPLYDAEINKNGLIFTTIAPIFNPNIRVFWDDSQLTNVGSSCSGSGDNQNNVTGAGLDNIFNGSISPCHAWNGNGNISQTIPAPAVGANETTNLQCDDFGNVRTINTYGWAIFAQDSATVLFACLQASGTIWNDINNSANGTNSNIFTAGENGTNLGNTLYVSLVDPLTGTVLQSVPVNPDGTYLFTAVPPNAIGLEIVVSNVAGVTGNVPPVPAIDPKWQNTSPLFQTFNSGTVNLTGFDFGVRTQDVTPDINQTIVNTPVSGSVATNDNVLPGSTFTPIGNMANGGTLVMNPNGTYTYTPAPGFVGRDSISYVACSPTPVICDTTTLTIVVTPLTSNNNNTVIAQDDHATTPINTAVIMCLLCNDSDPNGNAIGNPTVLSNPANGSVVVNPNGTVTYTPNPGFFGEDVYTYVICDNNNPSACDTANAYVTITTDPITQNQTYANDDAYTTPINTPLENSVAGNDTDPQNDGVTFTLVSGTSNGTVVLNPNGTFTYTPNPGYTGPDQFVYSKCDTGTPVVCDTATAYITINTQQDVTPDINQTLVNTPVSGSVATNDNVIPGSSFTPIGTMANGGTLVMNPDGTYTYTPAPGFVGRDSISYVACSPAPTVICDTTTLTIIVTPLISTYGNTVLAQDDHATTPINTPVSMCLLCNDSDPNGNTISNPTIIANPANGTVTVNPNGTVTYTPNPGFTGEDVYQYYICDNGTPTACDTAYAYVTIVGTPITDNQTYANDDAYVTNINTPINNSVAGNDTDPQNDGVTFTLVSGPSNGTLTLNTDGSFTYTPNGDYTGPDQFLYSKCDNGTPVVCDTATAYITIHAPIQDATPDINQTIVNTPVSGSVATNDNVIPGSTFTPIGTMENGTLVMNPNGTYTYTPNPNFVGTDSISYVVCSPAPVNLCDTTTLTIVVTPLYSNIGNMIIAQDDHATTPVNTPVTMCLLCNDSDPNGNTISNPTVIANPSNGTVVVNPNGTVTYTPNPGFTGEDVYQYYICDNGTPTACDTAYAYVTIVDNPITNNQTYANDDAYTTPVNTPINNSVAGNDTDPQNDGVTFTLVTGPSNGTVVLNPDGSFTYTPNGDYTGPDQFVYSKCDNGTPVVCDTATAYITINQPQQNANPDINQTTVNIPVSGTVATNDDVIPGSTFTQLGTMSNGTLVLNTDGTYTYTPNPGFIGRDSVQYIVCSPAPISLCDTTTLTIIVSPGFKLGINTVIAQDDHGTTPFNTPITMCIKCNDNDPQGDAVGAPVVISNPSNGTIVVNPNGTVTYTPNPGFTGTDMYTYYICDNGSPIACDTADVYIDVTGIPLSTNQTYANDDAYVTSVNTPVPGSVGLNDTDPQDHLVTFTQVSNPANGTVVFNTDGTFVYTPNNNYDGPDQFIYSKCDNGIPVVCDTATVYITIFKPNAALPAIMNQFDVIANDCNARLEWTTAQEFNVARFEIERKVENSNFEMIGTKTAVGLSQVPQTYTYTDKNVAKGNTEYRLRIVDIDGKFEYSAIRNVNISCTAISDIKLYPNPSSTSTTVSISSPDELMYEIKMIDAVGKSVFNSAVDVNNETKLVTIPVEHLASGIYSIIVSDGQNEAKVIRFQKTQR